MSAPGHDGVRPDVVDAAVTELLAFAGNNNIAGYHSAKTLLWFWKDVRQLTSAEHIEVLARLAPPLPPLPPAMLVETGIGAGWQLRFP